MNNTECMVEGKLNKPESINDAINNIDSVVEHAENLVMKMTGQDLSPVSEVGRQPMSLDEILSGGATLINDKCQSLHTKLDEIEKILY